MALKLNERGIAEERLYALLGGLRGWEIANLPVVVAP